MPTWKCHICGKERPDDKISVHTKDTSTDYDLPPGTMKQNVRYCNDNPDCGKVAAIFRFDKGKGGDGGS